MKPYQLKVEKPWGYELILTPSESPVTGKILHLKAGARFSYQYHEQKQETVVLIFGQAKLIFEDESGKLQEVEMESQKGYFIKPYVKHRCQAISDCDIMEASTPEVGKTVRLEDDYSRPDETEAERSQARFQK